MQPCEKNNVMSCCGHFRTAAGQLVGKNQTSRLRWFVVFLQCAWLSLCHDSEIFKGVVYPEVQYNIQNKKLGPCNPCFGSSSRKEKFASPEALDGFPCELGSVLVPAWELRAHDLHTSARMAHFRSILLGGFVNMFFHPTGMITDIRLNGEASHQTVEFLHKSTWWCRPTGSRREFPSPSSCGLPDWWRWKIMENHSRVNYHWLVQIYRDLFWI